MKLFSLLVACALASSPVAAQQAADQPASAVKASENYLIGPLDILRFRIVGEPETATDVRVASDGTITLPYVGNLKAGGMTVSQVRELIYKLYDADYFVNPQIDLAVIGYKERRVNVQGMVNQQGFVVFPPEEELTLLGAISAAGGWRNDRLSDKSNVVLTRTMPDGSTREYKINAGAISQRDWLLQDGDLITVHERRW